MIAREQTSLVLMHQAQGDSDNMQYKAFLKHF